MFEERKLRKLLEKDCEERRERNLQRLKELHPELFPPKEKAVKKEFNKKWLGLIVPTASVAVGLAIILPVVLVGNDVVVPPQPTDRYCSSSEYSLVQVEETIKQYNERSGKQYCYFDWYDVSEDIYSNHYVDNVTDEVLGVFESMYNTELEIAVGLKATPKNIYLETLEVKDGIIKNEVTINDDVVNWNIIESDIMCTVVHGDYRYYVTLFYSNDETQLFSLIEELLQ